MHDKALLWQFNPYAIKQPFQSHTEEFGIISIDLSSVHAYRSVWLLNAFYEVSSSNGQDTRLICEQCTLLKFDSYRDYHYYHYYHYYCGVEQRQLAGLISQRQVVQFHPPLPFVTICYRSVRFRLYAAKYSKILPLGNTVNPSTFQGVRNVRGYIIHIALRFPRAGAAYASLMMIY